MREECKPAQMRKKLGSSLNLSVKLSEKINNLDWNSRGLIDDAADGGHEVIEEYLHTIICTLKKAKQEADEYPIRGSLPDSPKRYLAKRVAEAIEKHLQKPATSSKDGIFDSVLTIILANVHDKKVSSVHDLCRKALKMYTFGSSKPIKPIEPEDE